MAASQPGGPLQFMSAETIARFERAAWGQPEAEIEALAVQARDEIHPISLADLSGLLMDAGFTPPRQYYQALWFGGWITGKRER